MILTAVAALTLAAGAQAQSLSERFESSMAAQAKIDYDFEQQLRQDYGLPNGKGMVWVSSHHVSVSADYDCFWIGMNHDLRARLIAIEGLIANPGSTYFEATIRDSKGEGKAFVQRPADEQELTGTLNLVVDQLNASKAKGSKSNNSNRQAGTITQAEKNLQHAWDSLSASKKNALRADQIEWIKRKDALSGDEKLAAIENRTTYLEIQ